MDVHASANVSFVERVLAAGVGDPATQETSEIRSTEDGWRGDVGLDGEPFDVPVRLLDDDGDIPTLTDVVSAVARIDGTRGATRD